jgi:RNA polymerase sigma-70 factor (ECF subfamily)
VSSSTLTDTDLVLAAQSGSRDAAGELFERHWAGAWRAALALTGNREQAEDVVQDAFESAFRSIDRVEPDRPFGAWLHRIVVNRALSLMRAERTRTRIASARGLAAEGRVDEIPTSDRLLDAVRSLPPERRVVIVLRYGLDYPLAEIAELLGVPLGTVQSRIHRALAELRPQFEDHDHGH